jgi:hypothetical protein
METDALSVAAFLVEMNKNRTLAIFAVPPHGKLRVAVVMISIHEEPPRSR